MSDAYLVITAVGEDRPGIVAELTERLAQRGGNVADSRMAVLGGEFALMMLVSVPADTLSRIQEELRRTAGELGLDLVLRETRGPGARTPRVTSYDVHVHALDHPGIVHAVTTAVRELGGNIVALETTTYEAPVTGTPLFRMSLSADLPERVTLGRMRDALDHVSDAANAEVEVVPVRRHDRPSAPTPARAGEPIAVA